MTREDIKTINDIVHKTIYGFFDICGDKETPMTDKDKLLLEVNKAVCNNIKDLEQEPCEDAISRQAAIDAVKFGITYASAINTETGEVKPMFVESNNELQKAINRICELPSVTPKAEPCEDTISRQEVQDLLVTWLSDYLTDETREVLETIDGKVGDMPSVTPKQRTGHWIKTISENGVTSSARCSECGFEDNRYELFNFCPKCGAKMEG